MYPNVDPMKNPGQTVFTVDPNATGFQPPKPVEFGEEPVQMACPYCQQQIVTTTEYRRGVMSWVLCAMVLICALCCDFTKDIHHYCPSCGQLVGRFRRGINSKIKLLVIIMIVISLLLAVSHGIGSALAPVTSTTTPVLSINNPTVH